MSEATHDTDAMQDRIDHAKAIAFEDGREHVYRRFEEGAGIPGHLPEDHAFFTDLRGPEFHITLMRDNGDTSVGIQPWECFVVTPVPALRAMMEATAGLIAVAKQLDYYGTSLLSKNFDLNSPTVRQLIEDARAALAPFGGGQ